MTKWTELNSRLDLFLGDTTDTYSEPLRIEAWNWAQDVFVSHTPRAMASTMVFDTGGREAILPDDFYMVRSIYDSGNERFWSPIEHGPGMIRLTNEDRLQYWTFGNRLFLESIKSVAATDLTLYYWAYYPKIEYSEDSSGVVTIEAGQVLTPRWAERALCHLTASGIMMPLEIEASNLNNYRIRIESGNPEHNPRAQSAEFHLRWYLELVGRFPRADVGRSG